MSWETATGTKFENAFFRNCEKRTEIPVKGVLNSGKIPEWLEGTLIRNGPGIRKFGDTDYNHAFDGMAVLHKFEIRNGEVYYQSRALESEAFQRNLAAGRIVVDEFGTNVFLDPCLSIFGKMQAKFKKLLGKSKDTMEMTDNCGINVAYYGDQLYAVTETAFIRRIDPKNLKSIGDKTRITDYCALNIATAHPHYLENGTAINAGNNFLHKKGPHYCFVKVPPAFNQEETALKGSKVIAEIPSRWKLNPSYFHSFGMTQDKLIFIEAPLCINLMEILKIGVSNDNSYLDCLKWYSSEKTRFHIVSMQDGKRFPITFETDAFLTLHHINAYEENNCMIVDVAAYNNDDLIRNVRLECLTDKNINNIKGATARRFILPLDISGAKSGENLVKSFGTQASAILRSGTTSKVDLTPHHLTKNWLELPRINYSYNGKKYNFTYGIGTNNSTCNVVPCANLISKINVNDGTVLEYVSTGEAAVVSEPVFVSNPTIPNPNEDDGVILTTVLEKDPTHVSLVILDAKDMKEVGVIQFKAEGAVTATIHGIWTNA